MNKLEAIFSKIISILKLVRHPQDKNEKVHVLVLLSVSFCFFVMTIFLSSRLPHSNNEELKGEISSTSTSNLALESSSVSNPTTNSTTLIENEESPTSSWKASDYQFGDIKEEKYQIKKGDTLWEIAEAKYGSGHEYKKIVEKNPNLVHFFDDGRIGLIYEGDELIL